MPSGAHVETPVSMLDGLRVRQMSVRASRIEADRDELLDLQELVTLARDLQDPRLIALARRMVRRDRTENADHRDIPEPDEWDAAYRALLAAGGLPGANAPSPGAPAAPPRRAPAREPDSS